MTDTATISPGDVDAIVDAFNGLLKPHGFQVHPFLVSWYNEFCSPPAYEQFAWPKQFSPLDPLDRSVYLRITHAMRTFSDHLPLDEHHHLEGVIEQIKRCHWLPDYALRPVTRMPLVSDKPQYL
ncbi:unnamed protein product [Dibothriocephalus latus]|uniref:Uncharacterized protein n=1 Tax=Dibothriocephalus latus TaxID=60516 RepID=A0A3P7NMJ4_DIBLA|nr:unnamed protein product [Dibothriocephalus latus]